MIDITKEELFTLAEAAKRIPRRRGGKKCNISTMYRWCTEGLHGIRLEAVKIGGTRCTSAEALSRFFQRLTEADEGLNGPSEADTDPSREAAVAAAKAKLQAAGIG